MLPRMDYRPGRTLVIAASALLAVQVAAAALATLGQAIATFALDGNIETYPDPLAPAFVAAAFALTVGGLGQFVTLIVTAVVFVVWFHRAAVNAQGFAGDPLPHAPGWAIGGFFVPIVNFIRPYQMARQIEAASGGGVSAVIGWWWALWIASNVIGNIEFRLPEDTSADTLLLVLGCSTVLDAIGAVLCARMMFYIEDLQAERGKNVTEIARVFD